MMNVLMTIIAVMAMMNLNAQQTSPCAQYPNISREYVPNENWHAYLVKRELCNISRYPGITPEEIYSIMVERVDFIAPGGNRTPVGNCKEEMLPFFNYIVTKTDDDDLTVTNYTLPRHLLHEGKVQRKIIKEGNKIYVYTIGDGNNRKELLAYAQNTNCAMELLWEEYVDDKLYREISRRLKNRPGPFKWNSYSSKSQYLDAKLKTYKEWHGKSAYDHIKAFIDDECTVQFSEIDLDGDGKPGIVIKITGPNCTNIKGESPIYVFEADGFKRILLIDNKPHKVRPAINGVFFNNNAYCRFSDYSAVMLHYGYKR